MGGCCIETGSFRELIARPAPPLSRDERSERSADLATWHESKFWSFKTKRFCLVFNTTGQKKWTFSTRRCLFLWPLRQNPLKKNGENVVLFLIIFFPAFALLAAVLNVIKSLFFFSFFWLGVDLTNDARVLLVKERWETSDYIWFCLISCVRADKTR